MVVPFDAVAAILILLAMALSTMPRQAAIAICLIASVAGTGADYLLSGVFAYYTFILIEHTAFLAIMVWIQKLKDPKEKNFFRLIAGMLLASLTVTYCYTFDWYAFSAYLMLSKFVAITHIAIMLVYSNGFQSLIGRVSALLHNRGGGRVVH